MEQPFILLSIWWITFFKHLFFWYMIMECIELNWLCKYMNKIRSSQAAILCTEFSKTLVKHSFFLWVSLKSISFYLTIQAHVFLSLFHVTDIKYFDHVMSTWKLRLWESSFCVFLNLRVWVSHYWRSPTCLQFQNG